MTIEQITALVNAGFTKEDILSLTAQEPAQQTAQEPATQAPAQEPAQEPQTAQEPAQAPQTAQEPAQTQPEYSNADVMKEIASLKSIVQAQNLAATFIPQVNQKDAAAVLAEVIRPERKVNNA